MNVARDNRAMLLTPSGAGAIGLIRVTGSDALDIVGQIFRSQSNRPLTEIGADRLRYGRIVDAGETIDDVVVTRSEDRDVHTVDICAHGGVRILERILELLERHGALFTAWDVENVDVFPSANLIEREALTGIREAKTTRGVCFAAWQREHLAGALDEIASLCSTDPNAAAERLSRFTGGYAAARTLLHGATVSIVGPPNSGKSTLLNRLVGRTAAVVSDRAGTTRDWVSVSVEIDGIAVTFVDTAGRRASTEGTERDAIAAGRAVDEEATLRLLVLSGAERIPVALPGEFLTESDQPLLVAINKSDLQQAWQPCELPLDVREACAGVLCVSAKTGEGIGELTRGITSALGIADFEVKFPCVFTDRQRRVADVLLRGDWGAGAQVGEKLRRELICPLP